MAATASADWASEDGELLTIVVLNGFGGALHAAVECIGETGWDWHAWDPAGYGQRYGLADTREDALSRAEQALDTLGRQLGRAA